jgi:uncharacterized repeat protein (TIGR03803 family)
MDGNSYIISLYSFSGGSDGAGPFGGVVADSSGNLFGTSVSGGNGNRGAVWALPSGASSLFNYHVFGGNGDGANPYSALALDEDGNIFGTTFSGGAFNKGTVFEILAGTTDMVILHSFSGTGSDGANPYGGITIDASGNLIGTTTAGGSHGDGTLFKLSGSAFSTFSTLHSFDADVDGSTPYGAVTVRGNTIYGTTFEGGASDDGTVYKMSGNTFTTLHVFGGEDGSGPTGKLVFDGGGNLFGTTSAGGDFDKGTVFGIEASSSDLTMLYSFTGGDDGSRPFAGMVFDTDGNLFGTTYDGGAFGFGTVFEIPFEGVVPQTLHAFTGGVDGGNPYAGVIVSPNGNLFGSATNSGGRGRGTLFSLAPTATTQMTIGQQPTVVTAGSKPTITVQLRRSNNAINTSDDSQVTLSILSGPDGAELGGVSTVSANNGVATFNNLQLTRAGTYTLLASDGSLDPVTLGTIVVNPAAATRLAFSQQPATTAAGATFSPALTVQVQDIYGNAIATSNSTITLSIASGPAHALLNGTLTVPTVNGVSTFSDLSLIKAGSYTLSASAPGFSAVKSSSFTVTPDFSTAHFVFTRQPGNTIVGRKISPGVGLSLQDQFGNLIASSSMQVSANLEIISLGGNATAAQLTGTTTVNLSKGVATFGNLLVSQPGDYQLEFSAPGIPTATSNAFNTFFVPNHLAFTQQPMQTVAGSAFTPAIVISILDSSNRVDTTNNSVVTLTLKGNGTLNGTVSVAAINGVATFSDLSIDKAGSYSLRADSTGLSGANSRSFTITPDVSTSHLAVLQLPVSSNVAGKALSPNLSVQVIDQFGNRITSDQSSATITILSGPTAGGLIGTTTVNVSKGVATFKNLTLPLAGDYTLRITDSVLSDPTPVDFAQTITQGISTVTGVPTTLTRIFGQTVTLSPTIKSNAPGSVPFTGIASLLDSSDNVLGTVALTAGGQAKFSIAGLAPGTYASRIVYAGDANHTAATSATFTLQVNLAGSSVALTTSANTLVFGQTLTLTATVNTTSAPGVPRTGTISFFDGATLIGTATLDGNSQATLTLDPGAVGKHTFKAFYFGDDNFKPSNSSGVSRTVNRDKTTTALSSSIASPISTNQSFSLNVHVSVIAPGITALAGDFVTIKDNGKVLATLNIDSNGDASFTGFTYTASGTHNLVAIYSGDPEALSSTSPTLKLIIV